MQSLTTLALLLAFTFSAFSAEPADAAALRQELDFAQRNLAIFDQKLAAARAAGVAESDTLFPELAAAWVHGDAGRLRTTLAKIDQLSLKSQEPINEFCPSLDEVRKALASAEKDPAAFAREMKAVKIRWLKSQVTTTLEDLRLIDSAIDQWMIENNKAGGTTLGWAEVAKYLKLGTRLHRTGATVFGDVYGPRFIADIVPSIPAATWETFEGVVPWKFFEPFPIAGETTEKK